MSVCLRPLRNSDPVFDNLCTADTSSDSVLHHKQAPSKSAAKCGINKVCCGSQNNINGFPNAIASFQTVEAALSVIITSLVSINSSNVEFMSTLVSVYSPLSIHLTVPIVSSLVLNGLNVTSISSLLFRIVKHCCCSKYLLVSSGK